MGRISILEYKRRVFNKALLECFARMHQLGLSDCGKEQLNEGVLNAAGDACKAFFEDELDLKNQTIRETKLRLSEAVSFVQDCVDCAEEIAEEKADTAKEKGMVIPDDQDIELSKEDEQVLDQLFDNKTPKVQADQIRDATVKALLEEDKKAEEIRNAVDIAKAQSNEEGSTTTLEETVKRIDRIGPTSLMHAIINNITRSAVNTVTETTGVQSIGNIMDMNRDMIKDQAIMLYSIYETASVFGICKWTPAEVAAMAREIYNEK